MLVDLHVHTFASGDAIAAPEELLDRALAIGLDGIVVTEHDSYEASETAADFGEGSGLVVLRGIEITTDLGHLLVYGLEDDSWRSLAGAEGVVPAQSLVDYVRDAGGVAVPAHPFRAGGGFAGEALTSLAGLFAIEGFNGAAMRSENAEACAFAARYELRLTGGSDAHMPGHVGRAVTQLERRVETIADLVTELKAGRFLGRYLLGPIDLA
jgi:predicted metal-dependent phosphoesterase TrpH